MRHGNAIRYQGILVDLEWAYQLHLVCFDEQQIV